MWFSQEKTAAVLTSEGCGEAEGARCCSQPAACPQRAQPTLVRGLTTAASRSPQAGLRWARARQRQRLRLRALPPPRRSQLCIHRSLRRYPPRLLPADPSARAQPGDEPPSSPGWLNGTYDVHGQVAYGVPGASVTSYVHRFTTLRRHRAAHARHICITHGAFPGVAACG